MFNSLKARVLLLIVGIVVVTSAIFMFLTKIEVVRAMYNAEEESAKNSLRLVMLHIESEYNNLLHFKENSRKAHKRELKNILFMHETYMRGIFEQAQRGLIKEDEAKRRIAEETSTFRFGKKDYIWIVDYNAMVISHANLSLIGKDFSQVKDPNGRLVVPPMIEIARKNGEGYHSYLWTRLNTEAPVEKLGYSRLFPEWKWVIGTGVYIDDIETEAQRKYDLMVEDLRKTLSKIKIARTGYVYILNGKKKMIIHPVLEGKDVSGYKNPVIGTILTDDLIMASKNPDKPFRYLWDKPADKGNYVYPKESYVAYFKPLDWYVASSVYEDEINAPAAILGKKIFITSLLILSAVIVISILFAGTVTVPIRKLIEAMKEAGKGDMPSVAVKSSGAVETKELGNIFNNMIRSIRETANEKEKYSRKLENAYNDLKASQEQIIKQEKMASIGQLAAGVAHEINNPIGFISSNLGTLEKYVGKFTDFIQIQSEVIASIENISSLEALEKKRKKLKLDYIINDVKELINESLDGSERVKLIVKNLKTFSRQDESEYRAADINDCIKSTLNIVWNELKYKATVHNEYGEMPPTKCYPQRLNQVFMNLLVNAAHAIENKGDISIKTWNRDGSIYASISDTGRGISEDKIKKIFEAFYTTKPSGEGTGLGLSISHEIMDQHNGEIIVKSKEGKGTTFTLKIPVVE
jgi:signal transduction histidine kinase